MESGQLAQLMVGQPIVLWSRRFFRVLDNRGSMLTRGLPRPYSSFHVDAKNQPLCYIPGRLVRASGFELVILWVGTLVLAHTRYQ